MLTDPIADMLTRIRNAKAVQLPAVVVPYSTLKMAILKIMKEARFIEGFEKKGKKVRKHISVLLKYRTNGDCAITGLKRISKPGRRIYKKATEIHSVRQGTGMAIVSTPKGVMTDKEVRKAKVGGEIICEVW
ncbi:30S ribosomal protein S8 [Candidatus Azambacteria bacterium]|nr:30S ribosomal protein S8 [Candidatus Azambacteria bacterium]